MPTPKQLTGQVKQFFTGLDRKQQLLLGAAAVATIVVLLIFVRFTATPEYKPLLTGMEPQDAQRVGAKLAAKNIPYEITSDGKGINVPADKVDMARLEVASGGMPSSGRMGFELFDKVGWGQTDFDEKVNYQRALEGELERTIQTLNEVESVRVHLVMPTDSVFIDRERAAKASVILKLKTGKLPDTAQMTISRLISGAVDKLSPENVTVIDADTNRPLNSGRIGDGFSSGNIEQEMTKRILGTLDPVIGSDHVRASVNIEYDQTSTEENQETFDPNGAVAVTSQRSEEQIGSGSLGGVPGTASNVPNATNSAVKTTQSADSSQASKTENHTFVVSKLVRHTTMPSGRVRRITAALLVDDAASVDEKGKTTYRKRTPEELQQLETLVVAAIGIDAKRGDAVTIQNISFVQPPVEKIIPPTKIQKVQTALRDWSVMVRYGALLLMFLLAYVLMLRPIKKKTLTVLSELPMPAQRANNSQATVANASETADFNDNIAVDENALKSRETKRRLSERVQADPIGSSRLVQAWLHEEHE